MELIILDSKMQERSRFDNFDSLVWNERFQTPGDFQLRSYGLEDTADKLPHGTLVSVSNSDFVMRVNQIDIDLDASNNEVVTVAGKTLERIFDHRPAVERIENTYNLDFNSPNGWEFGDDLGHVANEDPHTILMNVIDRVDYQHYGRPELSFLELPFLYSVYEDWETDSVVSQSRMMVHYAIDRAATVGDVLMELLPEAQMGVATLRPNSNSEAALLHNDAMRYTPNRPGMFVFYRPRHVRDRITFDYQYEDYTSENSSTTREDFNNVAQAHEDGVRLAIGVGSGLSARFVFKEKNEDDISQHALYWADRYIAEDVFDSYSSGRMYSLETSGRFPYSEKKYQFGSTDPNHYFLGDSVTLNLRGAGGIGAQVTEFIRTMDSNGYREYPTFTMLKALGDVLNNTIGKYEDLIVNRPW